MNSKNIKKHLKAKLKCLIDSIDDENVKDALLNNTIITGGALVSLLTGTEVNDYDLYFRNKESCIIVSEYYIKKWNEKHPNKPVSLRVDNSGKVSCFISSKGIADENEVDINKIAYNFEATHEEDVAVGMESEVNPESKKDTKKEKEKYYPRFITSNAISLSDKFQLVTRFYGEVEDIHKNYDFAHCTCAWSSWDNELFLPQKALECIINKELYYVGSLYPLCSIIRTRKYLERGYHINAGQYLKMSMQLNKLDLTDINVLEDQLTGVDTTYFTWLIDKLKEHQDEEQQEKIDSDYVIQIINKIF